MAKGIDFIIKIGSKVLGGQRGATLNRSASVIDTTTKLSEGWKENEASLKEWSISADGLLVEDDAAYLDLETAFIQGDTVEVEILTSTGSKYKGTCIITDFPLEMPYDDNVTYSLTLQGTGPIVKE
ncbi:phage major tail protein, TP901-1 family [Alkalithermobacter thermoalcaliphilus JW-YL-7 = DSM 7308]|uniref:Phage major tail protein, TP901-1 family n=1 Tax=Alkalithermobacter thermoalcaliphilus JW-YL-7 = DSM 7308 TaxID=1121328 RepID=A0A150FQY8_CLOPD|nr:phage major tail protein, TP901-1 family [[Clostridium] paradoxum JW-YL-7 = DSM 7308]SHL13745.1 phage major tail protein, TP901-1 family [[Clostridium] paradoxum JW-YL-7 = DSM 7308]